jgi:hypothetical protein
MAVIIRAMRLPVSPNNDTSGDPLETPRTTILSPFDRLYPRHHPPGRKQLRTNHHTHHPIQCRSLHAHCTQTRVPSILSHTNTFAVRHKATR